VSCPKQVFITMAAITAAGAYPVARWGSAEVVTASAAGAILATVNVLAGYAAVARSLGQSMNTFMKYVLGGMGVRLFAMAGVLLLLTRGFGFHATALVSSLGIYYLAYLALEVLFIQTELYVRQNK
jgi:Ca2+/H+ antiporter